MSELQEALKQMEACAKRGDKETALRMAELLSHVEPVEWKKALVPIDPEVKAALLKKIESSNDIAQTVELCDLAQLNVQESKPYLKRFILELIEKEDFATLKKYNQFI